MPIEIQELNIRSSVAGGQSPGGREEEREENERLRESILADCRQMIADLLRAERER